MDFMIAWLYVNFPSSKINNIRIGSMVYNIKSSLDKYDSLKQPHNTKICVLPKLYLYTVHLKILLH